MSVQLSEGQTFGPTLTPSTTVIELPARPAWTELSPTVCGLWVRLLALS